MTPRRVAVVGTSGSGKTHLSRRLARRWGLPYVELDAIYNQAGWTQLPDDEFRARIADLVAADEWVLDGNYGRFREPIWRRADLVVLLDYSRRVVMTRLLRRTVGRVLLRKHLWNGNRERWANIFSRDPNQSILIWAWRTHGRRHLQYQKLIKDPQWTVTRLTSPRETEKWFSTLP